MSTNRAADPSEIMQVAAGDGFSAALSLDGNVYTWGDNGSGQLGDGTYTERDTPVQVPSLDHVIAIATGDSTLYALKSDGTVVAWGYNGNGQVGNGTSTENFRSPQTVTGLSRIVAIAGGGLHGIALRSDGDVFTWGDNDSGQLGNNTRTSSTSPVRVSGINDVVGIAGQNGSTHALRADGSTWSWGAWGQVGDWNAPDDSLIPHRVDVTGVKALAFGPVAYHVAVTKTDATTEFWGDNSTGAYGDGGTDSSYNPAGSSGTDDASAAPLTNKPATRYTYDATGLRRSTTDAAAGTTTYTWDRSGPVALLLTAAETGDANTYVYGSGDLPIETVNGDGSVEYMHHDQLGSTRLLTNINGIMIGSIAYDAYGSPVTASSPVSPRVGFAGQYTDESTGFEYLANRYYDPQSGQFLTPDPLRELTVESYSYAGDSPTNANDPSGLASHYANRFNGWGLEDFEQLTCDELLDAIQGLIHELHTRDVDFQKNKNGWDYDDQRYKDHLSRYSEVQGMVDLALQAYDNVGCNDLNPEERWNILDWATKRPVSLGHPGHKPHRSFWDWLTSAPSSPPGLPPILGLRDFTPTV